MMRIMRLLRGSASVRERPATSGAGGTHSTTRLLAEASAAHIGRLLARRIHAIDAEVVIGGSLLARKGWPDAMGPFNVRAEVGRRAARFGPQTIDGLSSDWAPDLVELERVDGSLVEDRLHPSASLPEHADEACWDRLHLAYFSGEVLWYQLAAPFILSWPDIRCEELPAALVHGERRRPLRVTLPDGSAARPAVQTLHLDDDGLIRRLDYRIGPANAPMRSHFLNAHRRFGGLMIPTEGLVTHRSPEHPSDQAQTAVAISLIAAGAAPSCWSAPDRRRAPSATSAAEASASRQDTEADAEGLGGW